MNIDDKELERDIENAFRARGLKEAMRQWEAERKQTADHPRIPTQDEFKPSKWRSLRRTIYSLSAVAVLVGILVMAVPVSTWRTGYRQASRWAYKQYAHYFLPKATAPAYEHTIDEVMAMAKPSVQQIECSYYEQEILGHENPMHEATWQILIGNYAVAQSILEDVKETLNTNDKYYQNTMEDIAYLDALCYLGQNHRTKAMKLLNNIAKSNSRHSQRATWLVEEIK